SISDPDEDSAGRDHVRVTRSTPTINHTARSVRDGRPWSRGNHAVHNQLVAAGRAPDEMPSICGSTVDLNRAGDGSLARSGLLNHADAGSRGGSGFEDETDAHQDC